MYPFFVNIFIIFSNSASGPSDLTEASVHSFPLERVRAGSVLLGLGQQCCICLRGYKERQFIRQLPCRHRFHRDCIDEWLQHRHPTCPIDGVMYTNESVRQIMHAEQTR